MLAYKTADLLLGWSLLGNPECGGEIVCTAKERAELKIHSKTVGFALN